MHKERRRRKGKKEGRARVYLRGEKGKKITPRRKKVLHRGLPEKKTARQEREGFVYIVAR